MNNLSVLEGLFLIQGEAGVTIDQAMTLLALDYDQAKEVITQLQAQKEDDKSGIRIIENNNIYKFATKITNFPAYVTYFKQESHFTMSQALLEVVSIIAYRQPVTRAQIEDIRGVNSDSLVKKLHILGIIEQVGVDPSPGRPLLYGTTNYFLDYFDMTSLDELPELKHFSIEDVNEEVELFMTKYKEVENDNE